MERRARPPIWYLTAAASIVVGITPVVVLERWFGVPRKITVGFGVLAWAAAVGAKAIVHQFVVDRSVRTGANHRFVSVMHGLLSAVAELGVAATVFVLLWQPATLPQLIGFGVGAGMAEAVMLPFLRNPFKGSTLEAHSVDVFTRSARDAAIQWLAVLERIWATLLHVSSRGLVYLTITSTNPLPAAIAILGFACVDEVAYYGHLQKWRFDQVRTLRLVHAYLATVAALLTGAFILFTRVYRATV